MSGPSTSGGAFDDKVDAFMAYLNQSDTEAESIISHVSSRPAVVGGDGPLSISPLAPEDAYSAAVSLRMRAQHEATRRKARDRASVDKIRLRLQKLQGEIESVQENNSKLREQLETAKEALKTQAMKSKRELSKTSKALERAEERVLVVENERDAALSDLQDVKAELRQADSKHSRNLEALREGHRIELRRQRKAVQVAEKVKREDWIKKKSEEIRADTIRSLEPQMQRMLEGKRAQLAQLQQKHQREIEELEAKHMATAEERVRLVRAQSDARVQQEVTDVERRWQRRFDDLKGEHQAELNMLRRRIQREYDQRFKDAEDQAEERVRDAERRVSVARAQLREREIELEEVKAGVTQEAKSLARELLAEEKASREEMFQKRIQDLEAVKEAEMRRFRAQTEENLKEQHRKQIQDVVSKLDHAASQELAQERDAIFKEANARSEILETENRALRKEKEGLLSQLGSIRAEFEDRNAEHAELKRRNLGLEHRLKDTQGQLVELKAQLDDLHQISSTMDSRLMAARETEAGEWKLRMNQLTQKYEEQLRESQGAISLLQQQHESELETLTQRVTATIQKKDAAIEVLRIENQRIVTQMAELESQYNELAADLTI